MAKKTIPRTLSFTPERLESLERLLDNLKALGVVADSATLDTRGVLTTVLDYAINKALSSK